MDQKAAKDESDVNHLEVDDVRGDSTEEFNVELSATREKPASSEVCLIDQDKEGQHHEPQRSEGEQAQASDKAKQQQNEIRQTEEEPQKNEQEDVQEIGLTKEPSLSVQITENPNEAVQRRDVGKAAGPAASSEATKQKTLKAKETVKEPRENEKMQKTTIDRRTLFYYEKTERKKQAGQRRGVVEEEEIVQQQPSSFASSPLKLNLAAGLLLLSMIYILLVPPESVRDTDSDTLKSLTSKVSELKSVFSNQTNSFWTTFRIRSFAHLKNSDPSQPLVLLLAAAPSAYDVVSCMARKLAEVLDSDHGLITIDGVTERNSPGEKVKKKIDDQLTENFEAGRRVALVYRLDLLPPPSHMMFHAFCDDQNAPYKRVAILFTIHLPREPEFPFAADKEAEETGVARYLLKEVWPNDDKGVIESLLVRVAPDILPVNRESTDSVKAFCH